MLAADARLARWALADWIFQLAQACAVVHDAFLNDAFLTDAVLTNALLTEQILQPE